MSNEHGFPAIASTCACCLSARPNIYFATANELSRQELGISGTSLKCDQLIYLELDAIFSLVFMDEKQVEEKICGKV